MTPRGVLKRYHRAMLDTNADALANLYAGDGVHELPFTHDASGVLEGREAVRQRYRAAWAAAPIRLRAIVNVVVHEMADPEMLVAEQDIELTNAQTGADFVASFVLILRVRDGQIVHVRDYTDNLTIALALGRVRAVG
jgi:uncharacterized protein